MLLNHSASDSLGNTFNGSVEVQVFFSSEEVQNSIELRAVADVSLGFFEVLWDFITIDISSTSGLGVITRQDLEGGSFTSSVDTEQGKAFTVSDTKGKLINSDLVLAFSNGINFSELIDFDGVGLVIRSFDLFLFSFNIIIELFRDISNLVLSI